MPQCFAQGESCYKCKYVKEVVLLKAHPNTVASVLDTFPNWKQDSLSMGPREALLAGGKRCRGKLCQLLHNAWTSQKAGLFKAGPLKLPAQRKANQTFSSHTPPQENLWSWATTDRSFFLSLKKILNKQILGPGLHFWWLTPLWAQLGPIVVYFLD